MKYLLTLLFSCGLGCGEPAQVTLPTLYVTYQECLAAGEIWVSPNANPMTAVNGDLARTVWRFQCDALSVEAAPSATSPSATSPSAALQSPSRLPQQ